MNKQFHVRALTIAMVGGVYCADVAALEPQRVQVADGLALTPTLSIKETYDDNIHAAEADEVSSWVTTIAPTLKLSAQGNKVGYDVTYQAVSDVFHSEHDSDNTDHSLNANTNLQLDTRNRLSLRAGYARTEEVDSDTRTVENDKKVRASAGGTYAYGAPEAAGRIEVAADYTSLRYENGEHLNSELEYDSPSSRATFFYRVTPKTRLLVEGRYAQFDYVTNDDLDSESVAGLVGAQWFATAATSGSIKLGSERKTYDDSIYDDQTNGMWEASLDWSPLSYSVITLMSGQRLDEGTSGASAIDTTEYGFAWKHAWGARLKTEASYKRISKDYQDLAREDDRDVFKLEASYSLLRWLDVGLGYRNDTNDSNVVGEDYDRNVYYVNLTGSL